MSEAESPRFVAWLEFLLLFWALGTGLFFLVRFSFLFYRDNQGAIEALFSRFAG